MTVRLAGGFERQAAGETALHPAEDYVGYAVQEASFERFSIFIALPDEAPLCERCQITASCQRGAEYRAITPPSSPMPLVPVAQ